MVSQSHSSGTFILVELMKNNQIRHIESYRSNMKRMIFWYALSLDNASPKVSSHKETVSHKLPHLLIFPGDQALGFRLSKMWKFRDHDHPNMLQWIMCQAPLKRECLLSATWSPISQNETVRYSCPKGESYAAILCVRLTYPWRRTRLCINTLLNWIY